MLTINLDYKIVLFKDCIIYGDFTASVMVPVMWSNGGMFLRGDTRAARRKGCPSATLSTTHVHLVARCRMSGATPLHPRVPSWHRQGQQYLSSRHGSRPHFNKFLKIRKVEQLRGVSMRRMFKATWCMRQIAVLAAFLVSCFVFYSSANSFLSLRTDRGHVV